MPMHFGSHDQFVLAGIAVFGTGAAVVFLLWLTQRSAFAPLIRTFRGIAPNFLAAISVLFALNLAFLANDTWKAHDQAREAVHQEAASLRSILDLAKAMPPTVDTEIRTKVEAYARSAVALEWPLLAIRQDSPDTMRTLDDLVQRLATEATSPASGTASLALAQALRVRSLRAQRVTLSQTHVNPLKWLGMGFLGLLTMVSIALIHVDQSRAEALAIVIFAAAAAPTAAIILIHGNPFQQPTELSPVPIAEVIDVASPQPEINPHAPGQPLASSGTGR